MKVGDKVVCKTFPRKCTSLKCYTRNEDIIIGKSYTILRVVTNKYFAELRMLSILGERICNYWSDYFYTIHEYRKLKLEKLND